MSAAPRARRSLAWPLLLLALLAALPAYGWWSLGAPGDDPTPVEFEVPRGSGAMQVARDLHEAGLVRDPRVFVLLLRVEGLDRRLGEGLYDLHEAMPAREVAAALARGGRPRTVRVVVPEGQRLVDVAARLEAAGVSPMGATLARMEAPDGLLPAGLLPDDAAPDDAAPDDAAPNDGQTDNVQPDHAHPDHAHPDHAHPDHAPPRHALPPGLLPENVLPDEILPNGALAGARPYEVPPRAEPPVPPEEPVPPVPPEEPVPPVPPEELDAEASTTLEGYLFPAVYELPVGEPLDAVLARMVRRFEAELNASTLAQVEAAGLDLHAWVTLASMVQAEAANDGEMPIIAGVFLNRLDIGMPLQSDPTVAYGLGKDLPQLDFPGGDFDVDHPWNTYTRGGLPHGPINSPGRAALLSVLAPERLDEQGRPWLYFMHGRDDHGPVFRPNLDFDGHLRDVNRYLRR